MKCKVGRSDKEVGVGDPQNVQHLYRKFLSVSMWPSRFSLSHRIVFITIPWKLCRRKPFWYDLSGLFSIENKNPLSSGDSLLRCAGNLSYFGDRIVAVDTDAHMLHLWTRRVPIWGQKQHKLSHRKPAGPWMSIFKGFGNFCQFYT